MKKLLAFFITFLPAVALAAPRTFKELVDKTFLPIIDQGTKILIAIAILIFFWNIAANLWGEQSSDKMSKLRDTITWGLLIIFIMTSIWGILYILRITLLRGL